MTPADWIALTFLIYSYIILKGLNCLLLLLPLGFNQPGRMIYKMLSSSIALAVLLSLAMTVSSMNCSIPPLRLPLSNNTFSNGVGRNRGIPISLGTPGQPEGRHPLSLHC